MNAELVTALLQIFSSSLAFLREFKKDDALLQAVVDKARAEGRTVDIADVRASVNRMEGEGSALAALIESKKAPIV